LAFHFSRFFGTRHAPLLGIDIAAGGIRVIELAQVGKRVRVEHYAKEALPQGALRDDGIANFDQITDALRRALKKSGSRSRTAALALPSGSVISKTLILPTHLSETEIDLQIEIEASQSLPFALDEISLDYGVLGPSASSPDSNEILLVAARKDKINERLALAEAAGIKPLVMDIESHAARAALSNLIASKATDTQEYAQVVTLFQIGTDASSLTVLQGQSVLYEREQAFGSHKLEQDLARNSGSPQALFEAFNEAAAQELSRALQLFFSSTAHTGIAHIYLAGSSVQTPGLQTLLAQRLSTDVTLADPFSGMQLASHISEPQIKMDAPSCLVACGLAMRGFAP
jgi:type IV pilus assembly protein PilM